MRCSNQTVRATLEQNLGKVVIVYTECGGEAGHGFTGLVSRVNDCACKLIISIPEAPRNPFGHNGHCRDCDHHQFRDNFIHRDCDRDNCRNDGPCRDCRDCDNVNCQFRGFDGPCRDGRDCDRDNCRNDGPCRDNFRHDGPQRPFGRPYNDNRVSDIVECHRGGDRFGSAIVIPLDHICAVIEAEI